MILDLKGVIANQVFMSIQGDLYQGNVTEAKQREILDKIQRTVNTNLDGLVDRVIKVVD
tara:strand:+ start:955 stop:1131 length:177 start_codon:yes stop_codon:yes gene_type:complete